MSVSRYMIFKYSKQYWLDIHRYKSIQNMGLFYRKKKTWDSSCDGQSVKKIKNWKY